MIELSGHLTLQIVYGRGGAFSVGRLTTDVGDFSVKEAFLDQYAPGDYEGVFELRRIYPSVYIANGRLMVEVRAQLESMLLPTDNAPPV